MSGNDNMKWTPKEPNDNIKIYNGKSLSLAYRYYNKNPDKTTLVFLYGFDGNIDMIDMIAEAISASRPVLIIDYPGHGYSPVNYEYSIDSLADEINGLLDENNERNIDLLGYSFGGIVALKFNEKYKIKIGKMILLHTTSRFSVNIFKNIFYSGFGLMLRFFFKFMINTICIPILMDKYFDRSILSAARQITMYNDRKSVRYNFKKIIFENYDDLLKLIGCPVFVIGSKIDILVPASYSKRIARLIPNSKLFIFPDVGHLSVISRIKFLSDLITDFLK
jgi:pimeloyl-ACP methyl ester carboxylesterase